MKHQHTQIPRSLRGNYFTGDLDHLTPSAAYRLGQLFAEHGHDEEYDNERAHDDLIAEGLYTP